MLYYFILYYIMLFYNIFCYITLCFIILCYIILYCIILYIILYYIILYYIILYYIILYYIILYYILLLYVICYKLYRMLIILWIVERARASKGGSLFKWKGTFEREKGEALCPAEHDQINQVEIRHRRRTWRTEESWHEGNRWQGKRIKIQAMKGGTAPSQRKSSWTESWIFHIIAYI